MRNHCREIELKLDRVLGVGIGAEFAAIFPPLRRYRRLCNRTDFSGRVFPGRFGLVNSGTRERK